MSDIPAQDLESFVFGESTTGEVEQMAKDERKDNSKPLPKVKIQCVKCKGIFAQRPDVREKRIAKFGSAAKLESNYLCNGCRKGLKWDGNKYAAVEKKVKAEKKAKEKKK